jgi:hypothetical protein
MSESPYPLVEVAPGVWVRQIRAVWVSNDQQTHIRVDDHCTILTTEPAVNVVDKWREATR